MLTLIWTRGEAMAFDLLPEREPAECKGRVSDLGKSALMAYWSGRTMLARARSKI
jgi:hypothetical protein